MAASSRGPITCLTFQLSSRPSICCAQCLPPTRRTARWSSSSSSAPAAPTTPTPPTPPPRPFPLHPPAAHRLRAGIILTRPPLLTRQLTPFEEAFFFYQKRLDERLAMRFVQNIYYKRTTPKGIDWKLKINEREGSPARDLGNYRGRGSDAWKDELMVGDPLSKTEHMYEVLARDAVMRVSEEAEIIPKEERAKPELPLPRETDADTRADVTRLDRQLHRTLYLVVRNKDGVWGFPTDSLRPDEALHSAAARVLEATAGVNMNTWIVGRVPVAHIVVPPMYKQDGSLQAHGSKTFFIKGRIMAGQADLTANTTGYTEFKWLTPEEVKEAVPEDYFNRVKNMMPER